MLILFSHSNSYPCKMYETDIFYRPNTLGTGENALRVHLMILSILSILSAFSNFYFSHRLSSSYSISLGLSHINVAMQYLRARNRLDKINICITASKMLEISLSAV